MDRRRFQLPDLTFEVTTNNCDIADQIIEAGLDYYVGYFPDVRYACIENSDVVVAGFIEANLDNYYHWYYRPIAELTSLDLPFDLIAGIMPVALLLIPLVWVYLYRSGASTRDMLFWGAITVAVPLLGPLAALIFYRRRGDYLDKSQLPA